MGDSWKTDRIGSALAGTNPTVLARLPQGFAVIGDVQFLPGYCVLLSTTPADRLLDLPRQHRQDFLAEMDLLGEAVDTVCRERDPAFRRVNYEIHGNRDAILHAHVWPRYDWEPDEHRTRPVGVYPPAAWIEPAAQLGPRHQRLRDQLASAVVRLAGGAGTR